jgi:hypothetical protein
MGPGDQAAQLQLCSAPRDVAEWRSEQSDSRVDLHLT